MLALIAWRNIWRNKTRSLLVIISVMLGLWAGAFILAYVFGMMESRLEEAINNEVSHFQVHHPDFDRDFEARYFIVGGEKILNDLSQETSVQAIAPRVITYGMVASANSSTGGKLIGIAPENETAVTRLKKRIAQGRYLEEEDRNKVVIGEKLAHKLKVKLRSKIVLTCQDTAGNIVAGAFRIVGIFKTVNSSIEESNVYVRGIDLGQLIGTPGQYHEIAALVEDPGVLDSYLETLASLYPHVLMESWKELSPELGLMIDSLDQYMVIFITIILLALSFGIVNTMLMAVLERVREIGMLMAIGMNKPRLFGMITLETIFLVAIAAPVGLLAAFLTISYLGETGMDLSAVYNEGYAAYGFKSFIYPKLEGIYYWRMVVMVSIAALAASIYPAFTAVGLNPVKAIRTI